MLTIEDCANIQDIFRKAEIHTVSHPKFGSEKVFTVFGKDGSISPNGRCCLGLIFENREDAECLLGIIEMLKK
jgi:hypothetical protein